MSKLITLLIVFFYTVTVNASDTTHKKKYISISAGYTNSIVHGSMADRNSKYEKAKMTNREGFLLSVLFEKPINQAYLKYGLIFIKKQVNPMENTGWVYQDELRTSYFSLPFLAGYKLLPKDKKSNIDLELGPIANIKLDDNSVIGPDRASHKVPLIALSVCAGAAVSQEVGPKLKILLQYRYLHDVTNSYVEGLYMSSSDPNKKFIYKYKTHTLSFGFQWPI